MSEVLKTEEPTTARPQSVDRFNWHWCQYGEGHWWKRPRDLRGRPKSCEGHQKEFDKIRKGHLLQSGSQEVSRNLQDDNDYYVFQHLLIQQPGPTRLRSRISPRSGFSHIAESADLECEHGRLPGDKCPSPKLSLSTNHEHHKYGSVQNWPHTHPCDCWGGA